MEMKKASIFNPMLIWAMGLMLLSVTIAPSLAQSNCLNQYSGCLKNASKMGATNPELDPTSPSFNKNLFFCCPLLQHVFLNEQKCFCGMIPVLQPDSGTNTTVLFSVFEYCKIPHTLPLLEAFCVEWSPPPPPPLVVSSPPPPHVAPNLAQPSPPPTSPPPPPPPPEKKNSVAIGIGAVSAFVLLLTATSLTFCCWKKKKHDQVAGYGTVRADGELNQPDHDIITPESLHYEFGSLKAATNNFSDEGKLGQGGFGAVYKGILANGEEVAVKRLSMGSGQGDKEFKSEVEFVAKLQHRNLVKLMGFCIAKEERLLVYEFMQNKSLDYLLFDPVKQQELNWPKRYNIIGGVARGILYLHEDSPTLIIHRDLKAANVLLDGDMNPKIADFGLARAFSREQTQAEATQIAGTCGYMAPEFLIHGHYSAKSDVYSFGVLVLEIVSGKKVSTVIHRPEGGENLLSYAWRCLRNRTTMEFMDPTMRDSCIEVELVRCVQMGLLCLQEDTKNRPTMAKIVHMLNSDVDANSLPLPTFPAFLFGGGFSGETTASVNDSATWSSSQPTTSVPSAAIAR